MTPPTMARVAERLPMRVRAVEWSDPTLLVTGDDWTLRVSCPWRLLSPKGIALSWSSPDGDDRVWDLVGADIVRVGRQGADSYTDPVFGLSGDLTLEVFSDTELDPWVLTIAELTIVGPLARTDWP
jgi:hypothetical protein